jgi:hypothetical protein
LKEGFSRKIVVALAIASAAMVPIGVILSGVLAGWKGVAGSIVGFGLAYLYAAASIYMLKWVLRKPANMIAPLLMGVTWGRLLVLAGVLFALTFVSALNSVAMLLSFLALSVLYTGIEVIYAYKTFGFMTRSAADRPD